MKFAIECSRFNSWSVKETVFFFAVVRNSILPLFLLEGGTFVVIIAYILVVIVRRYCHISERVCWEQANHKLTSKV